MTENSQAQGSAKQVVAASKNALKTVYYVIVGLAITKAMDTAFLGNADIIAISGVKDILDGNNLLFLAFLLTAVRFFHGASIHFDVVNESDGSSKTMIDFIGFIIQGIMLYIMAYSLNSTITFVVFFMLMLVFDIFWLLSLRVFKYLEFRETECQWLISNILVVLIYLFLLICFPSDYHEYHLSVIVLVVSFLATLADYFMNKKFYFP